MANWRWSLTPLTHYFLTKDPITIPFSVNYWLVSWHSQCVSAINPPSLFVFINFTTITIFNTTGQPWKSYWFREFLISLWCSNYIFFTLSFFSQTATNIFYLPRLHQSSASGVVVGPWMWTSWHSSVYTQVLACRPYR